MAIARPAKTDPPSAAELELSLFGPGKGECVVLHLGQNEWVIVDSCLSTPGGRAVALDYLEQLGVDPAKHVKMLVVTHWHDDHIRGAAQVLRAASSAQFACSAALCHEDFFALIHAGDMTRLVEQTSGVREFAEIIEELQARAAGSAGAGPDVWAQDGMRLHSSAAGTVELHAISPSAQTITNANRAIARLVPAIGDPTGRVPDIRPNEASIAILVKAQTMHFLLGGDLEHVPDERCGWRGVLRSTVRPIAVASAYKVAHHGADNADCAGIWTDLLVPRPYAALTPYVAGKKPRPAEEDIQRIKGRARALYSTVRDLNFRPPRRRGVDGTIGEVTRNRRAVRTFPGHMRIRAPLAGNVEDITVAVFDGAGLL